MLQKLHIRKAVGSEYFETENLTRETFWNLYAPGCTEHMVLHLLRKSDSFICELDLVAVDNHKIIGHIISTKARVVDDKMNEHEVLCLGPVSVKPTLQGKGIGLQLMEHTIMTARDLEYKGIILFGNPHYYHRFGFKNAENYNITTKDGKNFKPFMALELYKDGLKHVQGRFYEEDAFFIKEGSMPDYERQFPVKEKGPAKIPIHIK